MADRAVEHLGETLRASKYSFRLVRDEYALVNRKPSTRLPRALYSDALWAAQDWAFEDEDRTRFSDEYCNDQRTAALENFDLNMAFFAQLSGREFLEALDEMLRKHKNLRPVANLTTMDAVVGVYVMVLDRYKQVYIGQAWDIRARIKRHWAGTKQFDRLIFGDINTSVLSIDSFRARDTTRIFAARTARGLQMEERLVNTFPPDFSLNRAPGGERVMGARFLHSEVKRRHLVPDVEPAMIDQTQTAGPDMN
jgi:hypothetical protein